MRKLIAVLTLCSIGTFGVHASAETNAAKAKALHESAKKAFEEAAKDHASAIKDVEEAGQLEGRSDTKWSEALRFEAEAKRYEPVTDLKGTHAQRLRNQSDLFEHRAMIDERLANNLEARSKRESHHAQGLREDAAATRKLAKAEKDAKLRDHLEALARMDEDTAREMDRESTRFKNQSDGLRKDAKALREEAGRLAERANKLESTDAKEAKPGKDAKDPKDGKK